MELTNKEKAIALLKSIETGSQESFAYIDADNYIQHNLAYANGLTGIRVLLQQLPPNSAKVNIVRIFQDDDFIFTHNEYNFFGAKTGFNIFRFENGRIVEHWDNLQQTPVNPSPSGHTMIDGVREIEDFDKTSENKRLVKSFIDDIFVHGKIHKLDNYFDGDNFIQHNPHTPDGISGLKDIFEKLAEQGIFIKYHTIHKILGEGNFVLVVSEGYFGVDYDSFYDLFRVENGKIAEHWDVIEPITSRLTWNNNNGKF
ncbi:nuclear transport factor 2 family protein [Sphingobacterium sp. HMA12]|uniref:nuclear transport factor 2 family protein n=1 Tax=Sphingobacterium sp. HMA12 TaxID=2050894 RepID=UPI000CE9C303|nr:nuclear transport factor 2 family protein [Sphingobacterium sp. HMA12]